MKALKDLFSIVAFFDENLSFITNKQKSIPNVTGVWKNKEKEMKYIKQILLLLFKQSTDAQCELTVLLTQFISCKNGNTN